MSSVASSSQRVSKQRQDAGGAWLMVIVCLIGISTGPAAFCLASIGLFAGPMAEEFGWSRTQISSAITVMMLCTALSMPLAGKLVDRLGVKQVLVPSVLVLGLCLMTVPLVRSYWQFIAVYVAIGTLAVGSNSVPYMRVLTHWFDRRRGLAIGIAGSGTGLGFAYVPLVTEALVSAHGWRGGYLGLGLIMLCFTLPMVAFVLKAQPPARDDAAASDAAEREDAGAAAVAGDSLAEAARTRTFWSLLAVFASLAFVLYGLIPHLVPLLVDGGMDASAAARTASLFGLATFAGRILIGFLIDRYDARRIASVFFVLSAVGLALLAFPLPAWTLLVAAVLLGGSLGAEVDMLAYLISRYFGLRCFAQIFGTLFAVVMVTMGLGPAVFGLVFDGTGSYTAILALGVPVCLLAVIPMLLLPPYAERRRGAPLSRT